MKRVTIDLGDKLFEQTDEIIERYLRLIVRLFRRLRRQLNARGSGGTIMAFDSLNALSSITQCYDRIRELSVQAFAEVARIAYKRVNGSDDDFIVDMWLESYLARIDPVTKYVFGKELDNKRLRLFEAVVAATGEPSPSDAVLKAVETAMKYMTKQIRQFGDDITLKALQQVYLDNGVDVVEWVTQEDERVCAECRALHGKRFP